jgi:prepilin-type N-terminal cleavage/methylation domain-containing protein
MAMKNHQTVEGRESKVESRLDGVHFFHPWPSTFDSRQAFTLIELLVVIAVIGVLAAMLMPLGASVKRTAYINKTRAEMSQLETAIDSYKAAYGFYPPDNPNGVLTNQLFYELVGTTNNGVNFVTLDGSAQISFNPVNSVKIAFGRDGFVNCNSTNKSAEDSQMAKDFLSNLKPQQVVAYTNAGVGMTLLSASVGGPDSGYMPLGVQNLNPWRYNSSNPTNNPGAYDLYVQLVIGGKTNLICNWSKQVQINSPLP